MDIFNYIKNKDKFYAHIKDGKSELLEDHIKLTSIYTDKLIKKKNINGIIENLGNIFFQNKLDYELWYEMLIDTINFHDIGKINENFQILKMKNKNFKKNSSAKEDHSLLSAKIYFDYYANKVYEADENMPLFLFLNMYIISKHHGYLDEFNKFVSSFPTTYKDFENNKEIFSHLELINSMDFTISNMLDWVDESIEYYKEKSWDFIYLYIYTKLLFSILVSSDFYSTSEFMNDKPIEDIGLLTEIDSYIESFKNTKVYKEIEKYKKYKISKEENPFKKTPINELRSELFLESQENLIKNLDKNIYFLEAPTGSGKTMCSINLAFTLLKNDKTLNKLFYVFPFNTLVEQTGESLKEILGEKIYKEDVSIINSTTPISTETNEHVDYNKLLLDRQFIHSPIILTTHVNFFNILFGLDREAHFPLLQLANSVVIIDEIQAYKNSIWEEIAIFLNSFSKILNIKIIIMSATLPKIDKLIEYKERKNLFTPLILDRKIYFENPLFSKRVQADYSLLEIFENLECLEDKFEYLKNEVIKAYKENKKVLIEFITKKSAFKFFKILLDEDVNLELLTGDDNKIERTNIITKIKNVDRPIILIATQVIEAGVDIDMDVGFKNISIVDAEEQFLGRVNRSCKKSGVVYFFKIDCAKGIYKNDVRSQKENTLDSKEVREYLINKDFENYYNNILKSLHENGLKQTTKNINLFKEDFLFQFNFLGISKRLKLIDEKEEHLVFFNREIHLKNETIIGSDIWLEYKNLIKNNSLSYAEKRVKLSILMEKMDYFLYKVKYMNKSYSDNIGYIFYIENSSDYFIEFNESLKFDREKFEGKGSITEFI